MLALRRDGAMLGVGSVVGWGWNYFGQCTPPANLGPVQQIAAGFNHSVALKVDGGA
jgi:alpha-tubulin suppressor-like RCC1 family protein